MANKNDYLRFSASSMKDLLRQNLISSGKFTDQIFEDSNLSVILDVLAFQYSVFMYYLNSSAAEGIFNDSYIYENMNRIVKMLGYNPIGFVTSITSCSMSLGATVASGSHIIPRFTTYTTGLTDTNGNAIKYSFADDYRFIVNKEDNLSNSSTGDYGQTISSNFIPTLYNGEWVFYNEVPISTGIPFEIITLSSLDTNPSSITRSYVSHNHIVVYVKDSTGKYTEWKPTSNLYNFTALDKYFEVRVNENYQYTLKFGDNINGKRLGVGDELYIIYLKSNGAEGQIGANILNSPSLNIGISGLDTNFVKYSLLSPDINTYNNNSMYISDSILETLTLNNAAASTFVKDFETVDEIRTNAPNSFRMGSRLITEQDFTQYILTNWSTEIHDVKVMNNWEYMITFQEWLRQYNKLTIDLRHFNYTYGDSCDFNNIYIFLKTKYNSGTYNGGLQTQGLKRNIEEVCNRLKPLTSELIPVDPIIVTFTPWVNGTYSTIDWDPKTSTRDHENKIVITRDRNTFITVERIRQKAIQIIQDFFDTPNCQLGMSMNIDSLYNQLTAIDGVKSVKTSYLKAGDPANQTQYYDGLSFAYYSNSLIQGADLAKVSGNFKLLSFQFPTLLDSQSISDRIVISSDNFNITDIEY